ncbi:MAG: type II secretion system protein [bacterium]
MRQRNHKSNGFTLVELLVVFAIVTLLAALAYPAIQSAIKRSWTTQDINSLRQISNALSLYVNDNNGRLPNPEIPILGTRTSPVDPDRFVFQEAVDRYMPPTTPGWSAGSAYNYVRRKPTWFSKFAQAHPQWTGGPAYNYPPGPIAWGPNIRIYESRWAGYISRIPKPSQFVAMGEINDTSVLDPGLPPDFAPDKRSYYRVSRPGNSALYLFCDFHIEQLIGDQSEPALAAANKPHIWKWW